MGLNRIGLYDKKTRCFYVIDFAGGSVSKGLQLAQGDRREPIAIGASKKVRKRIDLYGGALDGVRHRYGTPRRMSGSNKKVFLPGGIN